MAVPPGPVGAADYLDLVPEGPICRFGTVLNDPGLAAADELVLFLPSGFGRAENIRLPRDSAQTVGPSLGWLSAE